MRFMMPRERSTRLAATALILMLALAIACGGSAETTGTQTPLPTLEPTSTSAPPPTLEPTRRTPIPTLNPRQIQETQTVRVADIKTQYAPTPFVSHPTPVPTEPPPTKPATTPAPEPTSALRSTTNEAFLGQIPSYDDAIVTNFRFFQTGYDRIPPGERVFAASFDQRTARYIDWQLEFTAFVPTQELVIETKTVLYNSERVVLSTLVMLDKLNLGQECRLPESLTQRFTRSLTHPGAW